MDFQKPLQREANTYPTTTQPPNAWPISPASVGYPIPPNSGGGELGLFNSTNSFNALPKNQIVAVEFDNCENGDWDPLPQPHVRISISEISSVVYTYWNASNVTGKLGNASVVYNHSGQVSDLERG